MGIRSLFQRIAATKVPARDDPRIAAVQDKVLSPEHMEELQEAWADLAEAAEETAVVNLHTCSRTGGHWIEDPDTVRAIAAILREHRPSLDG